MRRSVAARTTVASPDFLDWHQRRGAEFSRLLRSGHSAESLGFSANAGDVSRFLARFRLAAEYQGAVFSSYSPLTERGYSALIGLFLAWSSFEQFAKIIGLLKNQRVDGNAVDIIFAESGVGIEDRRRTSIGPVLGHLAALISPGSLQRQLIAASQGASLKPRHLVKGLRNAFTHGSLTAHSLGGRIGSLTAACLVLRGQLLQVQQRTFDTRLLESVEQRAK